MTPNQLSHTGHGAIEFCLLLWACLWMSVKRPRVLWGWLWDYKCMWCVGKFTRRRPRRRMTVHLYGQQLRRVPFCLGCSKSHNSSVKSAIHLAPFTQILTWLYNKNHSTGDLGDGPRCEFTDVVLIWYMSWWMEYSLLDVKRQIIGRLGKPQVS